LLLFWHVSQGNEGFWVEKAVSLREFLAEAALATFSTQIKKFSLPRAKHIEKNMKTSGEGYVLSRVRKRNSRKNITG
jgi:hypothetical protein